MRVKTKKREAFHFMTCLYAVLWVLSGLILIVRMGRENRVFYPIGAFFLFLGAWWAAAGITGRNLFVGVWGWTLRGVTAVALALAVAAFAKERRKDRQNGGKEE